MNHLENNDKTQTGDELPPGAWISHHRIVRRIGAGGMGEVYLAEDTKLGRPVALKFLSPSLAKNEECRTRFKSEAQAAALLDHPNIVTVHEVGLHHGRPYFTMQYIEGRSLHEYCHGKDLSINRALEIAVQVCEGLEAAHQKGIVHGDIKPQNILMDSAGRPRIVDFGLASLQSAGVVATSSSTVGTVGYMSPEQARGETANHQTDIWSFGVMLFEMVIGRLPFGGEYEQAVIYAILNEDPPALSALRPDLPPELIAIVAKALAKKPLARYKSAHDMASDLRRLIETLKSGNSHRHVDTTPSLPSIAVLPFRDLSQNADQEYFCEGMAEELINVLARIEGLRVSARTSAFQFKGKELDIRRIGEQLGVTTLLEGSVRKSGNRLRVTTQLINVADGYNLWSERFDRDLDDVFAIQDEISLAVVAKLKSTLLDEDRQRITKRQTQNKEAYQLYLRGRYFWNRRYEGEMRRAIECFQQTITMDPRYAVAYTGIADCYAILAQYGWLRPRDAFPIAKTAVEKALAIDSELSEAHASMAWIKTFHDWDLTTAEAEFKRAIELNPNNVTAHQWYAICLGPMNRFDDGWQELDRALDLDPLSITIQAIAGLGHYNCRQFDEAIVQLNKTLDIDPSFYLALLFLGWSYAAKGMWPESIATLSKLVAPTKANAFAMGSLGASFAMSGQRTEAQNILGKLDEMARTTYVSPYYKAMVYAGLGENDRAFECLDQAIVEREPFLITLAIFPLLDSLRSDPRFDLLLNRIGLVRPQIV